MSTEIRIPSIGFATREGTLTEWLAVDGARVEEGQPLYSLELDKSLQEIEAPVSGKLKVIGEAGTVYQVGDLIAEIE